MIRTREATVPPFGGRVQVRRDRKKRARSVHQGHPGVYCRFRDIPALHESVRLSGSADGEHRPDRRRSPDVPTLRPPAARGNRTGRGRRGRRRRERTSVGGRARTRSGSARCDAADLSGFEVVARLAELGDRPRVVLISTRDPEELPGAEAFRDQGWFLPTRVEDGEARAGRALACATVRQGLVPARS